MYLKKSILARDRVIQDFERFATKYRRVLPAGPPPATGQQDSPAVEQLRDLYRKHKQRFDPLITEFFVNQQNQAGLRVSDGMSRGGSASSGGGGLFGGNDGGTSSGSLKQELRAGLGDLHQEFSSLRSSFVEGSRGLWGNLGLSASPTVGPAAVPATGTATPAAVPVQQQIDPGSGPAPTSSTPAFAPPAATTATTLPTTSGTTGGPPPPPAGGNNSTAPRDSAALQAPGPVVFHDIGTPEQRPSPSATKDPQKPEDLFAMFEDVKLNPSTSANGSAPKAPVAPGAVPTLVPPPNATMDFDLE